MVDYTQLLITLCIGIFITCIQIHCYTPKMEHMSGLNDEAISMVASLYNDKKLIVDNLEVKNKVTIGGDLVVGKEASVGGSLAVGKAATIGPAYIGGYGGNIGSEVGPDAMGWTQSRLALGDGRVEIPQVIHPIWTLPRQC